jgi:hypothetical protein
MACVAVAIVIGITYLSKMNTNPEVSNYNPTPLPTAPQTQTPPPQEPNTSQPPTQPEDQTPVIYEGIVAEVTFKENCWLRIRVDGGAVEEATYRAGTTKTLQGTNRIEFLRVGNAGGITIKLNGKELPPLGASGQVVSNYVITEETLQQVSSQ